MRRSTHITEFGSSNVWKKAGGILLCIAVAGAFGVSIAADRSEHIVMAQAGDYSDFFREGKYLRRGFQGESVTALQKILKELGFYDAYVDGVFGEKTEKAVVAFQKSVGLSADGVVGPATRQSLEALYLRKNPPETYTVKRGETLSIVAEKYGLSVDDLVRLNSLKDPDLIYEGQVLKIRPVSAQEEREIAPVQNEESTNDHGAQKDKGTDQNGGSSGAPGVAQVFPAPNKRICLSFDDGPDPSTTGAILDVLSRYGIKATFFVIGEKVDKYQDLLKQLVAGGHVVGIHGYEHKVLAGLERQEVRTDLTKAVDAVYKATGYKPYLYRPPGGFLDQVQIEEAARLGLTSVMWTNIGGADLGVNNESQLVQRIIKSAKDGGIILLHEGSSATVKALPQIIENLARLGFGFQNPSPGERK